MNREKFVAIYQCVVLCVMTEDRYITISSIFEDSTYDVQAETNEVGNRSLKATIQRIPANVQRERSAELVGFHRGAFRHTLCQSHFLGQDLIDFRIPHNASQNVL